MEHLQNKRASLKSEALLFYSADYLKQFIKALLAKVYFNIVNRVGSTLVILYLKTD